MNRERSQYRQRGFTMLEVMLVLVIFGLMASIALPNGLSIYQRTILRNTANEIESALVMARQLSMDESKPYEVLLSENRFSIRESSFTGKRIKSWDYPNGIVKAVASDDNISFNRNGVTGYGKFTIGNRRGERVDIEIHIGTGRVALSDVYR